MSISYETFITKKLEFARFPYPIVRKSMVLDVIEGFTKSRKKLSEHGESAQTTTSSFPILEDPTGHYLKEIYASLQSSESNQEDCGLEKKIAKLNRWTNLSRRAKDYNDLKGRVDDPSKLNPNHLPSLAMIFLTHYEINDDMSSLSSASKVIDRTILNNESLNTQARSYLAVVAEKELKAYQRLSVKYLEDNYGFFSAPRINRRIPHSIAKEEVELNDLILLFQDGCRARAYIQELQMQAITPSAAIILDTGKTPAHLTVQEQDHLEFFNPTIPIEDTIQELDIPYEKVVAKGFNDKNLIHALSKRSEKYALFCGAGIIKGPTLRAGPKLIHAHPGALPDARGSTTIFYNILEGKSPTVTTFFMEEGLDAGDSIHSAKYNLPKKGMEIGTIYDGIIRARTISSMLQAYQKDRSFFETKQSGQEKQYFVIHPALEALTNAAVDKQLSPGSFH